MTDACTYCNTDIRKHDPVFVEIAGPEGREPAGQFCNYACLKAYIEDEGLEIGASCEWSPP